MKQPVVLLGLALVACKVDMNTLLKKPHSDSAPADDGVTSPGTATTGATGKVAVKSDLCTFDEDAGMQANIEREMQAEKLTVCELITVEPIAGRDRVEPRAPGWCDQFSAADLENVETQAAQEWMEILVKPGDGWFGPAAGPLQGLCVNPTDAAVQKQTAYYYQWWVNKTGKSPDEIDKLLRMLGTTAIYEANMETSCRSFPAVADDAPRAERESSQALRAAVGCGVEHPTWLWDNYFTSMMWTVDADAEISSEIVRAELVEGCLDHRDEIDDDDLLHYAACGIDARGLDRKAFDKETAKFPLLARFHANELFEAAQRHVARYEKAAQAKASADPVWQQLLYDLPAQAWKQWTSIAGRTDLDWARAKPAKGCFDDAWKRYRKQVTAGAKTIDAVKAAMIDEAGTIQLEHVVACAKLDGEDLVLWSLTNILEHTRKQRGPRFAVYYALADALVPIVEGNSSFPTPQAIAYMYSADELDRRTSPSYMPDMSMPSENNGVVKKIKKSHGGFLIEFKVAKWSQTVFDCQPTGKVKFYDGLGNPVYEQDCKDAGVQKFEFQPDDLWIPAGFEGGIKAGTFVVPSVLESARGDDPAKGMPLEVWDSVDRKTQLAFVGIEL